MVRSLHDSYPLLILTNQGGDCTCGNTFAPYAEEAILPDEDCDTPCSADNGETCGGDNAAQVYSLTSTSPTSTSASGTTSY